MTLEVYTGSAWKNVNTLEIYDGSAWKSVQQAWVYTGSAWVSFFNSGVTMTTGSNSILVAGGKGTAGYSLYSHGFSPGSTVSGNYVDYDSFYSLSYPSFGSISGTFSGGAPIEVVWHGFNSADAQTGYFEFKLRIVVSGNIGGSLIPYVNGVAIAGAKAGVYNGSSQTVFTWLNGTRPNSGQTPIPGSDASTPNSNPFGADGTTPTISLL